MEKLARLGNGDRYGNSDGNMIARTTLAELNCDERSGVATVSEAESEKKGETDGR